MKKCIIDYDENLLNGMISLVKKMLEINPQ